MTILILDCNVIDQTANKVYQDAANFCDRVGLDSVTKRATNGTELTASEKSTSWDLILVPWLEGFASGADYTNLDGILPEFTDGTIPVYILHAHSPAITAGSQAVSGVTATGGPTSMTVDTYNSGQWAARSFTEEGFFGDPATALSTATAVFTDSVTGDIAGWRKDLDSRPTMWIAGASNSDQQLTVHMKPWLALQWAIDQQSTTAKSDALRDRVRKAVIQFWIDGFDDSVTVTDFAQVQTAYADAIAQGLDEIMVAAFSTGSGLPGDNSPSTAEWFADRDRSNGGIFRHVNHHTALPGFDDPDSGTTRGPGVTSDGVNLNNVPDGETSYIASSSALAGPFNGGSSTIQVGTDGLGAGDPYVSFTNYGNAPSAQYMSNKGLYFALLQDTAYPSDAFGTPSTFTHDSPVLWEGTPTVGRIAIDGISDTPTNMALNFNQNCYDAACFGGGLYIHPDNMSKWNAYSTNYYDKLNLAPDILAVDWNTQKAYIDEILGIAQDQTPINPRTNFFRVGFKGRKDAKTDPFYELRAVSLPLVSSAAEQALSIVLPENASIVECKVNVIQASLSGTTQTISVGIVGSPTKYLNGVDITEVGFSGDFTQQVENGASTLAYQWGSADISGAEVELVITYIGNE